MGSNPTPSAKSVRFEPRDREIAGFFVVAPASTCCSRITRSARAASVGGPRARRWYPLISEPPSPSGNGGTGAAVSAASPPSSPMLRSVSSAKGELRSARRTPDSLTYTLLQKARLNCRRTSSLAATYSLSQCSSSPRACSSRSSARAKLALASSRRRSASRCSTAMACCRCFRSLTGRASAR